jgi:hypothetical protein
MAIFPARRRKHSFHQSLAVAWVSGCGREHVANMRSLMGKVHRLLQARDSFDSSAASQCVTRITYL